MMFVKGQQSHHTVVSSTLVALIKVFNGNIFNTSLVKMDCALSDKKNKSKFVPPTQDVPEVHVHVPFIRIIVQVTWLLYLVHFLTSSLLATPLIIMITYFPGNGVSVPQKSPNLPTTYSTRYSLI